MLELKIREQAQRLIELKTYKSLCETKIRQTFPNHPLPITEMHLKKASNDNLKTETNVEVYKQQISELKGLLALRDNVRILLSN